MRHEEPLDVTRRFLSSFDEGLRLEPDFVHRMAAVTSRPRFATLLPLILAEPWESLLEVGISNFVSILQRTLPGRRYAGLGLHLPERFWSDDGPPIPLVQADLLAMPDLPDVAPFDVVVCSEVIEHVQGNPIVAFAGLHPLVRPGGRLIVSTPNVARLFNRVKLLLGRTPLERITTVPWHGHFREYTRDEVVGFLEQAGFTVETAACAPYWDTVDVFLSGGDRGFDAEGRGYYRPRFVGARRVLARPLLKMLELFLARVPSLQNGMVFVARRPAGGD